MTTHASETDQQSARDRAAEVGGTAREQTGHVAGTAKEQAAGVAGTAKEQAVDVAHDAAGQARNLLEELRQNVRQQMGAQRGQLADQLDGFASELRQMADRSDTDGPATEAVRQIANRMGDLKGYLQGDGDVAEDVRRFARRRPGAFLLACAAAGVLAGRATRGAAAARRQQNGGRHAVGTSGDISGYRTGYAGTEYGSGYGTEYGTGYGSQPYAGGGYGTTAQGGYGTATGPSYGAGTSGTEYGTGTAAGDPLAGVQQTSDPNLAPTSGPLTDRAEGYRDQVGDPVPPDGDPGTTGVDRTVTDGLTDEQRAGERGTR